MGRSTGVNNININNPSPPVHQQFWRAEVQGLTTPISTTPTIPPHLYTNSLDGQKYSSQRHHHQQPLLTCTPTISNTTNSLPVHQLLVQGSTTPTTPPHLYTNHQQHHWLLTCKPTFSTGFNTTTNPSSPVHQPSATPPTPYLYTNF